MRTITPAAVAALLALAALAGCKEDLPDSRLEATASLQGDQVVQVGGKTTLPDGANILVTLRQPGSRQPIVQALPIVKDHLFTTQLGPLDKIELPPGNYEIYVMFSPEAFAWSDEVLPAVGKKGEKLAGPQVRTKDNGVRVLETTLAFTYAPAAGAATSPTTTTTTATEYGYAGPYGVASPYGYDATAPSPAATP